MAIRIGEGADEALDAVVRHGDVSPAHCSVGGDGIRGPIGRYIAGIPDPAVAGGGS